MKLTTFVAKILSLIKAFCNLLDGMVENIIALLGSAVGVEG
jgi:hypothetical protein